MHDEETFEWDGQWRIYVFPGYAWFAPELPDGAVLVGVTESSQEAFSVLRLACRNIDGLYVPLISASGANGPDESVRAFIGRVSASISVLRESARKGQAK